MQIPVQFRCLLCVCSVALLTSCVRLKSDNNASNAPSSEEIAIDDSGIEPAVTDLKPFTVKFETTKGEFLVDVHPEWAPIGAQRFKELVESGYYDENRFFRVLPGFVVQFGLNGDPAVTQKWRDANLSDDPVRKGNTKGTLVFATSGPNSRTTQLFVNLEDNTGSLDPQGFSAFGEVVSGMDVVESINDEYGEIPNQQLIQNRGNEYLKSQFPNLDYIKKASIISSSEQTTEETETSQPDTSAQQTTTEPEPAAEQTAETESQPKTESQDKPAETIEEIQ